MTSNNAESVPPNRNRRVWWIAGAVVLVVAVIVVVLFAMTAGGKGLGPSAAPTGVATTPPPLTPTPQPGETGQTPAPSAPPAGLTATATPVPGVEVHLTNVEAVEGKASGVGEVGGPAIRFTVNVTNTTDQDVDLKTAVVQLYYGSAQNPGLAVSGPGGSPLPTSVAAGQAVSGVYLFTVPVDQRDDVTITFDYRAGTPVVVFRGPGPQ
ncbi:hypothetical protein [Leifsonia sp. LS-T14]|uniref:hypothetical protein n=1 Tax=unclassified Leifsonia TaxID=2663824 RepID=UPI0035A6543E